MKSVIHLCVCCFVAYVCGVKYKQPVLRYGVYQLENYQFSSLQKKFTDLLCGIFFW